eukprot:jgi/Phyca11/13200/fgenesh1_pg.PHYCAscaffold_3_\
MELLLRLSISCLILLPGPTVKLASNHDDGVYGAGELIEIQKVVMTVWKENLYAAWDEGEFRRRGIEDLALVVSWYRDTATSNVSEVVTASLALNDIIGFPVLLLDTGGETPSQVPVKSGNKTNKLTFEYIVQIGDSSARLDVVDDRIGEDKAYFVKSLQLPGGSEIKRFSTNPFTPAVTALPAPGLMLY